MEFTKKINQTEIYIPVCLNQEEAFLEIFKGEEKVFEFKIPRKTQDGNKYQYDYLVKLSVKEFVGEDLKFTGDFPQSFFDVIDCIQKDIKNTEGRPQIHFTANRGWINDPNGLIFDGENYHLYFQYNPFNVTWANMSWGHAISKDLLTWQELDPVMYPDEHGMIFSGCGAIINGEMCFPYTVAGTSTPWSEGKPFYQGIAKSYDGGNTLIKESKPFLGVTGKDSRDPKIFWHEPTKAYIMALYLEKYDFAIYRSKDFYSWEETQRFSLESDKGWECPNLLEIPVDDGTTKWMFWTADGFYYWGDFDGYTFKSDWKLRKANLNDAPYAAQTYWGVDDRIVLVTWLRLNGNGQFYNGAMGIPRELSARKTDSGLQLLQKPVREFCDRLVDTDQLVLDKPYCVDIKIGQDAPDEVIAKANGSTVCIYKNQPKIEIDGQEFELPNIASEIELIVDYNILEITIDNAIMAVYKTKESTVSFDISWRGNGDIKRCSAGDGLNSYYCLKSFK